MENLECDWIIHQVVGDDGESVFHTHGLYKHGMTELELKLSIESRQAMHMINSIAIYLIKNNIIIKDEYVDESNLFNCDIYFRRVKGVYGNGEQNIRIILPDPNFLFPWDDNCDEVYKAQLNEDDIVNSIF